MKKIVNGKVYNTGTAVEIGSFWNGLSVRDFMELEETLYKTRYGSYFLCGEGGPMTKYARSNGDTTWGSRDIIPLSRQEAFEWAQEFLSPEEVLSEFADLIQEA